MVNNIQVTHVKKSGPRVETIEMPAGMTILELRKAVGGALEAYFVACVQHLFLHTYPYSSPPLHPLPSLPI